MSTNTSFFPDLSSGSLPNKNKPKSKCTHTTHQQYRQDKDNSSQTTSSHNKSVLTFISSKKRLNTITDDSPVLKTYTGASDPLTRSSSVEKPVAPDTQLTLILAKLNELDAIKSHLITIDTRIDLLQSQTSPIGMVAQRS